MSEIVSTVTIGIIAYNEKRYLPDLLDDLLSQTYDKSLTEVILVDGESSDNSLEIMNRFRYKYLSEYADIKVINNPKRIQSAGWNIVIRNATADVLIRIDAHARLSKDFIESNVKCINSGENVCGGPRENIIDENNAWKHTLLDAEKSMFGAGFASYRRDTEYKKYVKSLFHGCYKKSVIEKVGLFNEELVRTEDNEYHYRIRQAGYRICYDPNIKSYYQTRNSLKGMIKQKFNNGLWIGKTLYKCPGCISMFHLVPCMFIFAIILTMILLAFGIVWPTSLLWCTYATANLVMSVMAFVKSDKRSGFSLLLPIIFLILHIVYGLGTIKGLVLR